MHSISLEMLRLADKIPACIDGQGDSNEAGFTHTPNTTRHSRKEDSIPTEVRRHISAHLSSRSSPLLSTSILLATINSNSYINQPIKLLWRTLLPGSPSDFPQMHNLTGLLDLPPELLTLTGEYLSPADMICLGLTCKQLFLAADYHLVDLKNLEFAGGELGRLFGDHQLFEPLATERYAVQHRLARDRLATLARQETHARLTCSMCIRHHPRRCFSVLERSMPARERSCLASTAPIRLCSHWTESHRTLRARAERSACEPLYRSVHRAETCSHPDHRHTAWSAPSLLDLGNGTYSIEKTLTILRTDRRDGVPTPSIAEVLRSEPFRDLDLCSHIGLADEVVRESCTRATRFEISSEGDGAAEEEGEEDGDGDGVGEPATTMPEFEPADCTTCGRTWQFSTVDRSGSRRSSQPRWSVMLVADDQIKVLKNPWTKEYLRSVQGGDELFQLRGDR